MITTVSAATAVEAGSSVTAAVPVRLPLTARMVEVPSGRARRSWPLELVVVVVVSVSPAVQPVPAASMALTVAPPCRCR